MKTCIFCGNIIPDPKPDPKPKDITFTVNGALVTAPARAYNDGFFEITSGKFKGNLVHRWDVIFYAK